MISVIDAPDMGYRKVLCVSGRPAIAGRAAAHKIWATDGPRNAGEVGGVMRVSERRGSRAATR
ncbi:hypothetical protein GCM10007886_46500 [Methylobacterium gregans]|nr:hypothetical protein GCM10007886_46500 [Methylobacterium gregans]